MARVIISGDFEDARKKLNSIGITLTTRPHKKGGFVCYANKELRESIARAIALQELPKDNIFFSGKL
jgi:hypothetical protein